MIFRSSILAGFCIGIAGFSFLAAGAPLGTLLFAGGLISVVSYKLKLFTGTAGFIKKDEVGQLALILAGNIVGCVLMALLSRVSPLPVQEAASKLLDARLATGPLKCGALAIGCGFLMTTAVTFARKDKWLPLLFCVPLFIVCGFPHCIADAFYYLACPLGQLLSWRVLALYACIVLGNFVGCNMVRVILPEAA